MTYQVGTPRFYVDSYSYFHSLGITANISAYFNFFGLNPSNQKTFDYNLAAGSSAGNWFNFGLNRDMKIPIEAIQNVDGYSVIGLLGHNFASNGIAPAIKTQYHDGTNQYDGSYGSSVEEIVNYNSTNSPPDYDGFSLYKTKLAGVSVDGKEVFNEFELRLAIYGAAYLPATGTHKLGCVFLGTYYDMGHSPDLNLKMSIEMDGVKQKETKGGSTLSNAMYTGPADWGSQGAWQLGNKKNFRAGRRTWNLSFSFLSEESILPSWAGTNYAIPWVGTFDTNILDGTDFFCSVWNKTLGNALPFIFQPDNTNNSPDQFAICKFDMNSLDITQTMHRKYNVSLKIEEVW